MESILELRNLVKLFPNQRAVDGISLKIPRGGFYSPLAAIRDGGIPRFLW
jgi:ABC-type multidrug transport system ATPase subunit